MQMLNILTPVKGHTYINKSATKKCMFFLSTYDLLGDSKCSTDKKQGCVWNWDKFSSPW